MARKKGLLSKLKKLFASKEKSKSKTDKILGNWEDMYKDLQSHPLTQAKIINDQLLESTNTSLEKVNNRLDEFDDRISKLEKRRIRVVRRIQQGENKNSSSINKSKKSQSKKSKSKKSKRKESVSSKIVNKIIADPHMREKEEAIVRYIDSNSQADTATIAKQFNISRSNASLKLNKLHDWGYLSKKMVDKSVFYFIREESD